MGLIVGSVSTMVFGMCATRVIGFVVGFVQDIVALKKIPVANATGVSGRARFEEVSSSTQEKKIEL